MALPFSQKAMVKQVLELSKQIHIFKEKLVSRNSGVLETYSEQVSILVMGFTSSWRQPNIFSSINVLVK